MKKYIILLICAVTAGIISFASEKNSINLKPKKEVWIRIGRKENECEYGFGLCLMVALKSVPDKRDVKVQVTVSQSRLVLEFPLENLSSELENEFTSAGEFPLEDDFELSREVSSQLELPDGSTLARGNYTIYKEADSYLVIIPVLN
jgi:hypothetical protein